jgi:hypothetical protein
MGRQFLWAGDISGICWEVWLTRIYEGPELDPVTGEDLEGTHQVTWHLEVVSSKGDCLKVWWEPSSRILGGGPLCGWGGNVIGVLKRHLLRLGRERGRAG